jgi:PEP-CTERM motif-containing protein
VRNAGVLTIVSERDITGGELQASPEPATFLLVGSTLAGLGLATRRRRSKL